MSLTDAGSLLLFVTFILMVMIGGDALVYAWPESIPTTYWALLDPLVHAVLALAVVSPLFARPEVSAHLIRWIIIAGSVAVLIDVDHFFAARSLSLEDALNLDARPIAHSLLFVLVAALATFALTRQTSATFLIGIALLSHILRDASHGGIPFFWPLRGNLEISIPLYFCAQIGLGLIAAYLSGWPSRVLWTGPLVQSFGRFLLNLLSWP